MSGNPEFDGYAREFMANQSDTTYAFRVHAYSGSVYVAEWNPVVSDNDVHDTETSHNLDDWLQDVSTAKGVELTDDELRELAGAIEMMVLNPEPEQE